MHQSFQEHRQIFLFGCFLEQTQQEKKLAHKISIEAYQQYSPPSFAYTNLPSCTIKQIPSLKQDPGFSEAHQRNHPALHFSRVGVIVLFWLPKQSSLQSTISDEGPEMVLATRMLRQLACLQVNLQNLLKFQIAWRYRRSGWKTDRLLARISSNSICAHPAGKAALI